MTHPNIFHFHAQNWDGRKHCPDTCLNGCATAMLWTRPADEVIAQVGDDLAVWRPLKLCATVGSAC